MDPLSSPDEVVELLVEVDAMSRDVFEGSSAISLYRAELRRLKDTRSPQFCRTQSARLRAPVFIPFNKIGSPRAPRGRD